MHLNDKLTIDGTRRTADGYLAVSAKVARGGNVQTYLGSEVDRPDLTTVRVFRPEAEVFSKDTLASFAHRPVTIGHPADSVTANTWKDVAKGWSAGEVARDGEIVTVPLLLADAEAIKAVESGINQLSMGYTCDLKWGAGISPAGEAYDAIQTGIRANHIAIVSAARGGSDLRIGDSAATPSAPMQMIDEAMVDAEAKKPAYDWCRGMLTSNGTPMEKHYAMTNLMDASPEAQRAAAARDHMTKFMGDAWKGAA